MSDTKTGASKRTAVAPLPRLALSEAEAQRVLGVDADTWTEHVAGHIHRVELPDGSALFPVAALEQWLTNAAQPSTAGYIRCVGCGKPIHPALHAPDRPERGRCLKCRGSR